MKNKTNVPKSSAMVLLQMPFSHWPHHSLSILLYMSASTGSSVRLLTKLRCFFVFSIKCLCRGFRSFPSRGDSRENESSTIILNQLHYSLPISLRQSCLGPRQVDASW